MYCILTCLCRSHQPGFFILSSQMLTFTLHISSIWGVMGVSIGQNIWCQNRSLVYKTRGYDSRLIYIYIYLFKIMVKARRFFYMSSWNRNLHSLLHPLTSESHNNVEWLFTCIETWLMGPEQKNQENTIIAHSFLSWSGLKLISRPWSFDTAVWPTVLMCLKEGFTFLQFIYLLSNTKLHILRHCWWISSLPPAVTAHSQMLSYKHNNNNQNKWQVSEKASPESPPALQFNTKLIYWPPRGIAQDWESSHVVGRDVVQGLRRKETVLLSNSAHHITWPDNAV